MSTQTLSSGKGSCRVDYNDDTHYYPRVVGFDTGWVTVTLDQGTKELYELRANSVNGIYALWNGASEYSTANPGNSQIQVRDQRGSYLYNSGGNASNLLIVTHDTIAGLIARGDTYITVRNYAGSATGPAIYQGAGQYAEMGKTVPSGSIVGTFTDYKKTKYNEQRCKTITYNGSNVVHVIYEGHQIE